MCTELLMFEPLIGCAGLDSGFVVFSISVKVSCPLSSCSAAAFTMTRPDCRREGHQGGYCVVG